MTIPTAAAVLKEAASHIGYREGRNNDNMFGEFYGANNTAWCAQFVYYCVRHAGAEKGELIRKSAWCPDFLSDARAGRLGQKIIRDPARGDTSGTPVPGDIGLVQRTRSQDSNYANGAKHIFLVEKYLGNGYVQTIEGNTSNTGSATGNGVYRLKRKLSNQIVILRPAYAVKPPPSGGGGGGVPKPQPKPEPKPPKVEIYHIDPAKVSTFLAGNKKGKLNIVGRPGRNLEIEKIDGNWAITPSGNAFHKAYLKKGKFAGKNPAYVDLSDVRLAAKEDPKRSQGKTSGKAAEHSVKIVEACLEVRGLLVPKYAEDGAFGSTTVEAYARWQRSKAGGNFSGGDADGIPGEESLERLVESWGYVVRK